MEPVKPSLHMLTIWRIRLLVVTLVPAFFSASFTDERGVIWTLFTLAWVGAFLYFYIFYYPIKWKKLLLASNAECLLIHCGVIYTRVKAIPLKSIVYVVVTTTPLMRFFGVCSLVVHMAGTSALIPGLLPAQAATCRDYIESQEGKADA